MSERPEGIPQWAWDEALKCSCVLSANFDRHVESIARALLKAREEAVNEAADLVEWRFKNHRWRERDGIAVRELAIRQHSQKGER